MSDPLLMAMVELSETLAHAQKLAAEVQRMLIAGASDEDEECKHPVGARSSVSGMGHPAFHCRLCGAIVEEVPSGEADPN
jgi:hypothetical protein